LWGKKVETQTGLALKNNVGGQGGLTEGGTRGSPPMAGKCCRQVGWEHDEGGYGKTPAMGQRRNLRGCLKFCKMTNGVTNSFSARCCVEKEEGNFNEKGDARMKNFGSLSNSRSGS